MTRVRDPIQKRKRPLPSFEQWLDKSGHTDRADGYNDWAALEDFVRRTLKRDPDGPMTDDEASFFRMFKGMGVAIVELCNGECSRGRTAHQILQTMPRVLGAMAMYAAASALDETTPWRTVARVLIEEFRFGAKEAADQLGRQEDRT